MAGRYLEQFEPGEVIRHAITRTIIEADNVGMTDVVFPNPVFHGDTMQAFGTYDGSAAGGRDLMRSWRILQRAGEQR